MNNDKKENKTEEECSILNPVLIIKDLYREAKRLGWSNHELSLRLRDKAVELIDKNSCNDGEMLTARRLIDEALRLKHADYTYLLEE